jgi:mRNA-degrading endonuclease toxin of MazEF toxin-antitoxin module
MSFAQKGRSVIVSANPYNDSLSPLIGIVPLTTAVPKNPVHIKLTANETGLQGDSYALIDNARFLDRTRLGMSPAGRLIPEAQSRLDRNLARVGCLKSTNLSLLLPSHTNPC